MFQILLQTIMLYVSAWYNIVTVISLNKSELEKKSILLYLTPSKRQDKYFKTQNMILMQAVLLYLK